HWYDQTQDHLHFGIYPLSMFPGQLSIPASFGGTPIQGSSNTPPDAYGWGHVGDDYWPTSLSVSQINASATFPICSLSNSGSTSCSHTDGFVDPVAFIKGIVQPYAGGAPPYTSPTFGPTCQNGSS